MKLWPVLVLLAGCGGAPVAGVTPAPPPDPDQHAPDYARRPYERFSRTNAIAIAMREWRAFGSGVDDGPPRAEPYPRADNEPGLWQRVGDYWWGGLDAGSRESGWTPRYNEFGASYAGPAPAWSAAFISYIMRMAGAGGLFTYSALHADYINAAANGTGALQAERPDQYAPVPGDLICLPRGEARGLRFADLPARRFTAHCDLVVAATPAALTVVGGNVGASVTMRHVPVSGGLIAPGGQVLDGRYDWFVVLRVRYEG